jgi:hypothetical protein
MATAARPDSRLATAAPSMTVTHLTDGRAAVVFDRRIQDGDSVALMVLKRNGQKWYATGVVPEFLQPLPKPLTRRQHDVLTFLHDYYDAQGYAPQYDEICKHFGWRSIGTAHEYVHDLERKGYLRIVFNEARGIVLNRAALPARPIPMTRTPK